MDVTRERRGRVNGCLSGAQSSRRMADSCQWRRKRLLKMLTMMKMAIPSNDDVKAAANRYGILIWAIADGQHVADTAAQSADPGDELADDRADDRQAGRDPQARS